MGIAVRRWTDRLQSLQAQGRRVAMWGTGGKGTTFLNALPPGLIGCVVDINPNRQGSFTPCTGHLISSPEALPGYKPDLLIVTNPLYEEEIRAHAATLGVKCNLESL